MELIDGKTYARPDGTRETIGGTCKDYPAWVWSIAGNWYERTTGKFVAVATQRDGNGKEAYRPEVSESETRALITEVDPESKTLPEMLREFVTALENAMPGELDAVARSCDELYVGFKGTSRFRRIARNMAPVLHGLRQKRK